MDLTLLRIILVPIFLCTGTIGNILSIIAVTNKHCKKSSYTVYIAGLAVADLLVLYASIIEAWLPNAFGINLKVTNPLYCKLHVFHINLFSGVSIWLVAVLALERTFCMYFPLKMKSVCTPKRALIMTTMLLTFFIAYNAHSIYGMQLQPGIKRTDDLAMMSADTDASTNLDRNENTTLSQLEDVVSASKNNDSNNTISEVKNTTMEPESIACNSTDTNAGNHTMPSSVSPFSDVKHFNQPRQTTFVACKSAKVSSGNVSEAPPVSTRSSIGLNHIDDQSGTPPSNDCNSTGQRENGTLSLLSTILNEICKRKAVMQSPNGNGSFSHASTIKPTSLPTKLTGSTENTQNMAFCGFLDQSYADFSRYWTSLDVMVYFCFPLVIIITANTATWIQVYRSSRGILKNLATLMQRRTRHVVIITSLISAAFIVFVTPVTLLFVVEVLMVDDLKYPLYNEDRDLWDFVAECLYLCNHSFNFFLYILSGRRFRNSLKAAFCKLKSQRGTPKIQFELQAKPLKN